MGLVPYNPRVYDAYFTGVEGEVDFYIEEALDSGGSVLELGCGTGRVLLPIARRGIEVTGLDVDASLLEVLRDKLEQEDADVVQRVEIIRADMAAFKTDQLYDMVIIPYRAFQHLLTPTDQQKSLECIGQHLGVGGRLVLNTYDPLRDIVREGFSLPVHKDSDFIDPETGHTIVAYFSRQYDIEVQIIEQEFVFEEFDRQGVSKSRWANLLALRWTPQGEMRHLLERYGFQVEALYGDFSGGPYVGYGEQVWVASKV